MEIEVHDVAPKEWRLLKEVRLRSLADAPYAFDSTLERESARSDDFWKMLASGRSERNVTVMAFAQDRCIGLAGGVSFDDEDHPQLVMMWVDPSSRSEGVGAMLMHAVIEWATGSGYEELRLWVAEDNVRAWRLYERCGFRRTGDRKPLRAHPQIIEFEMSRQLQ